MKLPALSCANMDKVDPENCTKPSKFAAIRTKWNKYANNATLHGLSHIVSSRTVLRRVLWCIFLLTGIGYVSYQWTWLVRKYLSYPVNSKVTVEFESTLEFPAITICNFNMLRQSFVDQENLGNVGKYVLSNKLPWWEENTGEIDWKRFENVSTSATYSMAGHQIKDMVMECYWIGEMCSFRNFTPVLTSMGLCHTFNSGQDGSQILKVNKAGADSGLRVMLNIGHDDYFSLHARQAGLKVLIHHHETPPIVDQLGFAVGPGASTFAAIKKEKTLSLKWPYESNCSETPIFSIPGYNKYTTSTCTLICKSKYLVDKCGCRDPRLLAVGDAEECGLKQTATCIFRENDNFYKETGERCTCPVPCETISFNSVLSFATFPSEKYIIEATNKHVGNVSKEERLKFREFISSNFLELNVYFQDLQVKVLTQQPAYGTESLLGEAGGLLGLCIGASLLTVMEVFDLVMSIIAIKLGCIATDSA